MNTPVKDLLTTKGREVVTVTPDQTVYRAVERMVEHGIGCVVVVNKKGALAGILSERDCLRKIIVDRRGAHRTVVRDVMTPRAKVVTVTPDKTIEACMAVMTNGRFRHLPVVENGAMVGLISIGDVVKFLISEKDFIIKNLEQYITGV